ncbi:hypothetical protein [Candidatus Endoriftia persephonae]|jgi:hypothetical protein|uniref:UDP-2,3-diacylglucosamine hydrolase n=1 Tax=Candidatus Endoriftia persephonae TaxID=393765 RepID=A0A9J6ZZT7_9GAMM|nr:hypothetical protein [Candidatus Endoriftia persephone]USF88191.1 UDP-2,3-diacylglucosamine hydrolase [Candidatus Endoriftia persephone]
MRQKIIGILLVLALSAAVSASATELDARLLVFRVSEPGAEPYISRVIVSDDFLRLDQGASSPGFILLDRQAEVIYSVNPDDRLVLVFRAEAGGSEAPVQAQLEMRQLELADAPTVAGVQPQEWQISVAGQLCERGLVAPGLMPEARAALQEYQRLLARQQLATLASIPPEFQEPCDLLLNIQRPGLLLQKGLPLQQWSPAGHRQELLDFRRQFPVNRELFVLPESFRRLEMSPPSGGAAEAG